MGRVMLSGVWRPAGEAREILNLLNRTYKRDRDGKFSSGSGTNTSLTEQQYQESYGDTYDEATFGDEGVISTGGDGDVQIAFRRKDGTTDVFADMDADEAQAVLDHVEWAKDATSDRGVRGPDPDNGMLDWREVPSAGLIVGSRPGGDVAIASDDGEQGIVLSGDEIGDFTYSMELIIQSSTGE